MCGHVVEWLRSAYTSEWALHWDNPDAVTQGRYVFAPDTAPHYPDPHNLWSRNWTTDDSNDGFLLGELPDARQRWTNGAGPDPFPEPRILGDDDCISLGEQLGQVVVWENAEAVQGSTSITDLVLRVDLADSVACGGTGTIGNRGSADLVCYFTHEITATIRIVARVGDTPQSDPSFAVDVDGSQIFIASPGGTGAPCTMRDYENGVSWLIHRGKATISMGAIQQAASAFNGYWVEFHVSFSEPVTVRQNDFREGFPQLCYVPEIAPKPPLPFWPDVYDRSHGRSLANVIGLLYTDPVIAEAALTSFLGSGWTYTVDPTTAVLGSGTIIARAPQGTVAVVSGTTTFEQLALQAMYAGAGAVSVGPFKANFLHYQAANILSNKLAAAGVGAAEPIVLVGHSLGGAMCLILAGLYLAFNTNRQVELLTFGCPRVGNRQLRDILEARRQCNYANVGDPVPGLPPIGIELLPLLTISPALFLLQWGAFSTNGGQRMLYADGRIVESSESVLGVTRLFQLAALAIAGSPFPFDADHDVTEYAARLGL